MMLFTAIFLIAQDPSGYDFYLSVNGDKMFLRSLATLEACRAHASLVERHAREMSPPTTQIQTHCEPK